MPYILESDPTAPCTGGSDDSDSGDDDGEKPKCTVPINHDESLCCVAATDKNGEANDGATYCKQGNTDTWRMAALAGDTQPGGNSTNGNYAFGPGTSAALLMSGAFLLRD